MVSALGGVDSSVTRLGRVELPERRVGDADPAHERGVGDLDPHQRHVVDALATGSHLFIDAPVGSDVAGTLAAVVSEANASGRSVLYVPGHRRAADALAARLDSLGLGGLLLDIAPVPTWRTSTARRLLEAMAPAQERIDADGVARVRDALIGSRAQLAGYIGALHQVRDPWRVSAYDALQALARLTSERPAPATRVRLAAETVLVLDAERRAELAVDLERAAELGAFTLRSASSPVVDAHILTDEDARSALARRHAPRRSHAAGEPCARRSSTSPGRPASSRPRPPTSGTSSSRCWAACAARSTCSSRWSSSAPPRTWCRQRRRAGRGPSRVSRSAGSHDAG